MNQHQLKHFKIKWVQLFNLRFLQWKNDMLLDSFHAAKRHFVNLIMFKQKHVLDLENPDSFKCQ